MQNDRDVDDDWIEIGAGLYFSDLQEQLNERNEILREETSIRLVTTPHTYSSSYNSSSYIKNDYEPELLVVLFIPLLMFIICMFMYAYIKRERTAIYSCKKSISFIIIKF